MNFWHPQTLLEAAAITLCLVVLAGQQTETVILLSQVTVQRHDSRLDGSTTLRIAQNPSTARAMSSVISANSDTVVR